MTVKRTVRRELQHRFLKIEIALIAKRRRDSVAFVIQRLRGELLTRLHLASVADGDLTNRYIRDIYRIAPNLIRLMRRHQIRDIHFAATALFHLSTFIFPLYNRIHLGLEISHVIHLLPQLLHADYGQKRIIDNRRFTHFEGILRQAFLRFGRRVRWSGIIYVQLQFPESENLRILFLTQVIAQFAGRKRLVVHALHPRFIQQTLILRHEFRRVARAK